MTGWLHALTLGTAVGAAVNGGVFFAFSSFVMQALGRLPAARATEAMQAINEEAPSPRFMVVLLGTGVASVVLIVVALAGLDEPEAPYLLVGSVLFLASIFVTGGYHIPRNNALARLDPEADDTAEAWRRFFRDWSRGNHVRTATCIAGAVSLALALTAD